jgi:hypothetical protein
MAHRVLLYATLNWPSAARYAAGFHTAGCEVHALSPHGAPVRLSRYVAGNYGYDPLAPLWSLDKAIADCRPDLIVPCDDRAVSHLIRLHEAETRKTGHFAPMAALIARSLGRPENYARVISRSGSLAEMAARGVRVPDTFPIASENELEARLAVTGFPAVLKADGSSGGDGVVIAHTLDEAKKAYRRLSQAPSRLRSLARFVRRKDAHHLLAAWKPEGSTVCVQRFISGRPAASAFAACRGEILSMFHYDVLVADGEIGPPNVIRRIDSPEMDRAAQAAAECFGLSGMHGLDFIRDENDALYLIEINPRPTQGGTLPFGTGRDLPSALAQTLSAQPVGMRAPIENDVVAFFPREWRRDPSSRYLREGYHDIPADDPEVMRAMLGKQAAPKKPTRATAA